MLKSVVRPRLRTTRSMPTKRLGSQVRKYLKFPIRRGLELRTSSSSPTPGGRLEIVVESAESGAPSAASQLEEEAFQVAALGPRFLAGMIDGLLLLLSAGLFAFIFRFAGGHLRLVPLNLAVLGVIATIFIWSYFGMFTALTATTPGLSWMGIEARNMEGWPPDRRESLLRAFGYLVSLSAFLLGFFWALVDGESLTWHDRISGTFLTPARQGSRQRASNQSHEQRTLPKPEARQADHAQNRAAEVQDSGSRIQDSAAQVRVHNQQTEGLRLQTSILRPEPLLPLFG